MNIVAWILQIVLAVAFVAAGGMKLARPKPALVGAGMGWAEPVSDANVKLIGAVEVIGGIGLIVPWLTGIAPILTPIAAVGLALVMADAVVVHVRRKENFVAPLVLGVLSLVLAVVRFAPYSAWMLPARPRCGPWSTTSRRPVRAAPPRGGGCRRGPRRGRAGGRLLLRLTVDDGVHAGPARPRHRLTTGAPPTSVRASRPAEEASVKIGLHVVDFTSPSGPAGLADDLTRVVVAAEEAGFGRVSVMDHLWQIMIVGPPELDMLEAYTTLGYIAARTEKVELLAWVTAVTYREPGLLAKLVSTLDVLSKGRAILGIGAAWNADEATGLGLPFPPTAERFERLEETLQICRQMWGASDESYAGTHYQLGRTLNVPQPLRTPPILIGGGGEKKTLRLVAQYAQLCNLFARDDYARKLDVLRGHCEALGRDYDDIEKTITFLLDPGEKGENVDAILEDLKGYAALGFQEAHCTVPRLWDLEPLKIIGREIVPAAAEM